MKKIILCLGVVLLSAGPVAAQSMLEYAGLTTATAAAATKSQKGKSQDQSSGNEEAPSAGSQGFVEGAMANLYGETSQMMSSKSAALLGRVGAPASLPAPDPAAAENASLPVFTGQQALAPSEEEAEAGSPVTLILNSGQEVKGALVEQGKDYVRLDIAGVTTTYFSEEISRIE